MDILSPFKSLSIRSKIWLILLLAVGVLSHGFLLGNAYGIFVWPIFIISLVRSKFWRFPHVRWTAFYSAVLVGFMLVIGLLRSFHIHPEPKAGKQLTILDYNLFFKNQHKSQIVQEIQAHPADLIVFQEYTPAWEKALSSIATQFPYRRTFAHAGSHGLAIYSKYPLHDYELIQVDTLLPFAQVVNIEAGNAHCQLINAHLPSPAVVVENPDRFMKLARGNHLQRRWAYRRIMAQVADRSAAASLMIGDLNTISTEPVFREIKHEWTDCWSRVGSGWGFTFPHTQGIDQPFLRLDYAMIRGAIRPIEMEILPGSSSDHLGIKLQVEI
ncbi:endonuclease/exonuclease/phosphatase family protein [Pontibacter sp. G13]|uniref:endonuclease/exonuclease/phosphatase family protein n=1 Tax=Pontibacter sp. G13 TaxID=3074898 RepID=UPI00288C0BD4|nr:endonuclease/exonuclease/phosphatase family protein [Pontibacter sp. G13]WNJ16163.1 endonuclease/exonuclease/phosphatase family protein [Pontibacter sp. G13]